MKQHGLFIIGTDTDVGKTFVTSLLGGLLSELPYHLGLIKPIASGALTEKNGLIHSQDADELMRLANIPDCRRKEVNPIALPGEYSPKIAAQLANQPIIPENILHHIHKVVKNNDYTLVEGAGGITTPINDNYTFTDLVSQSELPALLVSDGRLGSINRVVLTVAYAKMHHIAMKGIIINDIDGTDTFLLESNICEMQYYTQLPILATLPPYKGPKDRMHQLTWAKQYINIKKFLTNWEA